MPIARRHCHQRTFHALLVGVLYLAGLALPASLAASEVSPVTPEISREIDRLFARWNSTALPGCTIGVSRDGREIVSRAYGMSDLEHSIAIRPDTIIEAGSVSKQFTAAAVLLLVQAGKISLDDPVRKYIPEVPDYGTPLTLRHLITHTSGLRDWGFIENIAGWPRTSRAYTHAHVLDIVSRQKALNFAPGADYSYTNTGFNLLAILVSRVTGKSFQDYSREAIFAPLGMTRTSWRDDFKRIVPDRAIGYTVADSGVTMNMPFENVHGNGGLLTTVGDLLRWNENAVNPKVGGEEFVKLQRTHGRLNNGEEINYTAGLYINDWKGVLEVNHSGGTAGYRAWLAQYPTQHNLSVAILCNASDAPAWIIGRQVAELFLDLAKAPEAPPFSAEPSLLAEVAGLYRNVGTHEALAIEVEGDHLKSDGAVITPMARDLFRVGSGSIRMMVQRDSGGKILGVHHDILGEKIRFERVERANPTQAQLAALAGEYTSEEAEVALRLAVEGGRLVIHRRPDSVIPLEPNYADGFSGSIGQVRFFRDSKGVVNEMSISQDRVWDLRFTRSAPPSSATRRNAGGR